MNSMDTRMDICADNAQTGGMMRRPNGSGHTPPRSIRVPDDLWDAAKAKAAERGETVTEAVVRALERYVKR